MDINDVKVLIKSLVVSSTVPYSVPQLLIDFENEAGFAMPIYKFSSPKAFLKSLTDIVQFVGQPPYEKIRPVPNEKSKHISSLIERQSKTPRHKQAFSQSKLFLPKVFSKAETPKVVNKIKSSNEDVPKLQVKVGPEETPSEVRLNKNDESVHDNNFEDFIFKENEIKNLQNCPGLSPRFGLASTSKTKKCDNISKTGSYSSINNSSTSYYVNAGVKEKLRKLMKKQTQGIWCCDLPDLYEESYASSLEFKEFGYRSLIDMVKELTEIFRCVRPGNGDWLLFDASKPPSEEESNMRVLSQCKVPENIEKNLLELIECHYANGSKPGIYLDDLLALYFRKFRERLNFAEIGFPNIKSLVCKLNGQILRLDRDGQRFIIKPMIEQNVINEKTEIFLITPEDDVFNELFPADVVKQGECFPTLEIGRYFFVGEKVEVNVADVWSPEKFYVQLKEHEQEFLKLTREIQEFYNRYVNKYKMPEATIQPNQICVALYTNGDGFEEWHRSLIVKNVNRDEVVLDFVDYGNRIRVDKGQIRFLHRYFFNLPAQAFAAKLSFVEPVNGSVWPLEVCKKFVQLVTVPAAEFHIQSIDSEKEVINGVIISINGKERINVGGALVLEGMAMYAGSKTMDGTTLLTRNTSAIKEMPVLVENVLEESKNDKIESGVEENHIKNNVDKRSLASKNEEIYTGNGLSLAHENGNKKSQHWNNSKCTDVAEKLLTDTEISESENICTIDSNMVQTMPTLRMKRDVYALAFSLLSTNNFIKKVARVNLEKGLLIALNSAEKLLETSGMSLLDCE